MATDTMTRPTIHSARPEPPRPSRRRRLMRLLVLVVVLALIGTVVWLVGFSSVLATRQVQVSKTSVLSAAQVRAAGQVPIGLPLARQDLSAIATRIAALPPVESVAVSRRWPDTVSVQITERTPAIAVKQGSGYELVDRHGIAFDTVSSRPKDVAAAEVDPANGPVLIAVAQVVGALPADLAAEVTATKATTLNDITLTLDGGLTVVWGSADQTDLKVQVLQALRDQKGSYKTIDVSAPHSPAGK